MPMMPDPVARLDHHEVEPQRQTWDGLSVGERAAVEQAVRRGPDPRPLAVVHRLLGKPERAAGPPPNLDHDQGSWRARVDRHEVELVATDMDVPGQNGPTGIRETCRDNRLGGITRPLGRRSRRFAGLVRHSRMVASSPYPRRIRLDIAVSDTRTETQTVPNTMLSTNDRNRDDVVPRA